MNKPTEQQILNQKLMLCGSATCEHDDISTEVKISDNGFYDGNVENPKTGDTGFIVTLVVLLLAIIGLVSNNKKR